MELLRVPENPKFAGLALKDQKTKLLTYAVEITSKLDTAKEIIGDISWRIKNIGCKWLNLATY